ncbi:MAG TPA: CvpA family protein [Saprospiraceae bacterium]|nr:CvpA family protein [Saprospiraceae bacterium]
MNGTDVLIILGIVLYMALGFRDGLFKKIYGILGFWGGLILAIKFMNPFSETLGQWLDFSTETCLVLAFFIIFLVSIVIANLLYRWFGKSSSDTLQFKTRITGALLGGAQGLVAVSLILIMFSIFEMPSEDEQRDSMLYHNTLRVAPAVFNYSTQWMPASKDFFETMKTRLERFTIPR